MRIMIYLLCLFSLIISCSAYNNDKQKADDSIRLALQHENDGASLSEDVGIVEALEFYKAHEPTDTTTIMTATRLVASYYWWAGEKAKAYDILERYIEEYPDDNESRYTLLNFLVLDSDYKKMEHYLMQSMSADDSIRSFRKLHERQVLQW